MLEFEWTTILWTVVNLLVLYLFLRKFLFGRVNAVLEQRQALIQQALEDARAKDEASQASCTAYEAKLAGARQEAEQILSQAKAQAERDSRQRLEEAQQQAARTLEEARARTQAERAEMLRGARQEVASLALMAAAKAAGQSMDAPAERALVESFLSEVGERV